MTTNNDKVFAVSLVIKTHVAFAQSASLFESVKSLPGLQTSPFKPLAPCLRSVSFDTLMLCGRCK